MVRETKMATVNDKPTVSSASPPSISGIAWKALLGLICIWLAVFFDIQAFWGVLFLMWTWTAIKSGRADFIEPVDRNVQPFMYWAFIGTWVVLSIWLIAMTIAKFS